MVYLTYYRVAGMPVSIVEPFLIGTRYLEKIGNIFTCEIRVGKRVKINVIIRSIIAVFQKNKNNMSDKINGVA